MNQIFNLKYIQEQIKYNFKAQQHPTVCRVHVNVLRVKTGARRIVVFSNLWEIVDGQSENHSGLPVKITIGVFFFFLPGGLLTPSVQLTCLLLELRGHNNPQIKLLCTKVIYITIYLLILYTAKCKHVRVIKNHYQFLIGRSC